MSLGGLVNRVKNQDEIKQGVSSELLPELTVDTPDADLIASKNSWMSEWNKESSRVGLRQKTNKNYWKGKFSYNDTELSSTDRPEADNLIFQSLETFLPLVTRQNPEPTVECPNEEQAKIVKDALVSLADVLKLKLKLRSVTRNWALSLVGVGKVCWNIQDNRTDFQAIEPTKLILDPKAYIEGGIYHGRFLGEYKTECASDMIVKFPKKKEYISSLVHGKMATEVTYIEWHTNQNLFWTLNNEVLDKSKNPNWNYDGETKQTVTDEMGTQTQQPVPGRNHLQYPQIPYAFLTVFTTGEHPWDDTSLIEQNLYLQDLIHKRLRQINVNNNNINGGWIFTSRSGLTADQATQATDALREGGSIYLPSRESDASRDVSKQQGSSLPPAVYESLIDYRNELRGIFGTQGSTPQGIQDEKTVRGKILTRAADDSRNSLTTEYLEQFTDYVFNWFVQMMFVYGDTELVSKLTDPMVVSMKEGSLIPKDSLTMANQAIDLWSQQALAPEDLFKRLEDADVTGEVQRLVEWRQFETNPMGGLPSQGIPPMPLAPQIDPATGQPIAAAAGQAPTDSAMPQDAQNPNLLSQVPVPQ